MRQGLKVRVFLSQDPFFSAAADVFEHNSMRSQNKISFLQIKNTLTDKKCQILTDLHNQILDAEGHVA